MQRKRPTPGPAADLDHSAHSCSSGTVRADGRNQLHREPAPVRRAGAGGVPARFHNAQQHPGAVLERFRTVKYHFRALNQNFFKKRVDKQI